ncbi:hypothetical protein [Dyella nitratireducens]|uniref:Lysine-specific metallo-endopeptidase domain-containing protein n=1 Tax=Dyella nitratireducens TaxID=1849580 RepID=A0ABQ1G187_9GAMM|nr:hypothetical protein [Dyella nitratireducens]GGA34746.1 hypothetical protein GCM10010981_24750 [Dyella nitratireducens]GLQ40910.1 hypothetical protein GCM10007902_07600 [Dyella nitratireducens]
MAGLRRGGRNQDLSKHREAPDRLKDPEAGKEYQADRNKMYTRLSSGLSGLLERAADIAGRLREKALDMAGPAQEARHQDLSKDRADPGKLKDPETVKELQSELAEAARKQDLSKYRMDPDELKDPETGKKLQPDENGLYTRRHRDRSEAYFITTRDGDIYQVGFDPRTMTWHVLDPRTGRPVRTLGRHGKTGSGGELTDMPVSPGKGRTSGGGGFQGSGGAQGGGAPGGGDTHGSGGAGGGAHGRGGAGGGGTQGTPGGGRARGGGGAGGGGGTPSGQEVQGGQAPVVGPESPGDRENIMNMLNKSIGTVRNTINKIDDHLSGKKPLSPKDAEHVREVYGDDGLTPEGLTAIKNTLTVTVNAMEQSLRTGASNVHFGSVRPGASAQADLNTGQIVLSREQFAAMPEWKQTETMAHEFTHIAAFTKDNHYLDQNDNKHANLDGKFSPEPFGNADSYARLTTHLR